MAPYTAEWQSLADRAAEPNPFYEPWAIIPAFEFLSQGVHPRVVTVWSEAPHRVLLGVFPIARRFGYHRLPLSYLAMWRHMHCFLGTPIIEPGREAAVWREFLEWIARKGALFEIGTVGADGPVFAGLRTTLPQLGRPFETVESHARPLLAPRCAASEYLGRALRAKRRRQFDKKREILERDGPVHFEVADHVQTLAQWSSDFIALEGQGWKGRGKTALRGRANEEAFFHAVIQGGGANGKVRAYRLVRGGKPLAMRFDLLSGGAAFALKIAYDEAYARCSPGALLEIEILHRFFSQPDLRFIDSCTIPSPHSIHGYFWSETRVISSVAVAGRSFFGRGIVSLAPRLRRIRSGRSDFAPAGPTSDAPAVS